MAIGLTFEEYVELKLMPPKHADRAFVTAAEHMRDEAFPMSLAKAAWHVRTRGYDCRPKNRRIAWIPQACRILTSNRLELQEANSC